MSEQATPYVIALAVVFYALFWVLIRWVGER